jgi:hypothetical protein
MRDLRLESSMGVQVALGAIAITPYAIACLLYVRLWTDGYGMVEVFFSHLAMESGVPGYGFSPVLVQYVIECVRSRGWEFVCTAVWSLHWGCVCPVSPRLGESGRMCAARLLG